MVLAVLFVKNICEIKLDSEFDNINNKFYIEYNIDNFCKVNIKFNNNDSPCITLENNSSFNRKYPGVRIKNIKSDKKMFESGLRKGDIILFINNIPCLDHSSVINIINYASINGKVIGC